MNNPSNTSLDDPSAFNDEGTIELTDVVEDSSPDIPIVVDNPNERHRELEEELLRIGGLIQESRLIEGYILAKVNISNKRYVATCALQNAEINESFASIREGLYLVLKGHETGFHVLGGNWSNHIEPFVVEYGYETVDSSDKFFGLSADLERHHSKNKKRLRGKKQTSIRTIAS